MNKDTIVEERKIPEGYEVDVENSTLFRVVFKKKVKKVKTWEDLDCIGGYYVDLDSKIVKSSFELQERSRNEYVFQQNKNIAFSEKAAKSMLAIAQLSQLMPHYDVFTDSELNDPDFDCYIPLYDLKTKKIVVDHYSHSFSNRLLIFHMKERAEEFIRNNEQLVRDYLMVD